jgi:hydrogenase large subunit
MGFKNLPVEFDDQGRARLKEGIADPYSVTTTRPPVAVTDEDREAEIRRLIDQLERGQR